MAEMTAQEAAECIDYTIVNDYQLFFFDPDIGPAATFFIPHFSEKFNYWYYDFKRMFQHVPIYDDTNHLRSAIDLLLSNTTVCMAVEVKRWLETQKHVDEHIHRLELIRKYPAAEVKGKTLLGAIVGAVVTGEARDYAEQNGLFVLELTGEDVRLLEPPEGFQPKAW